MINTALDFISKEVNAHLNHLAGTTVDDYLVVSSIVYDGKLAIPDKTLGLTLMNIEEDRFAKDQRVTVRNVQGDLETRNPDIYLNLFVLVSANFHYEDTETPRLDYLEGLKRLSQVIAFFQSKSVFTQSNSPSLAAIDRNIEKLAVELFSFNFEQMNHFWSIIGHSYLPSVLYKIRMLTIQENVQLVPGGIIERIQLNTKTKL
ncbi:DUF4255 domain-containing protein [Pedobacter sandarakinus]|uniref:DUF4255 domain-containing protein n=1 Tax=Pedobacter sandarakinus TaxID=353156 RepID=UPI002247027D|nr:DUF4255 domain-containing protein [Pedobacter sandarakinus]MCX2574548.1 DUF4255 domain-containing protein [Pedobacter sandarakinus]